MNRWTPALTAIAAVALFYLGRRLLIAQPDPGQPPSDDQDQETNFFEDLTVAASNTLDTLSASTIDVVDPEVNRRAFLDMIAYSEGTAGPNGYRTMFSGGLFDSFDDHPRRVFSFTNSKGQQLTTSAAGRYQFLARTWDSLKAKLDLADFSPESQDAAALELVRQRGALADVDAGRIDAAIRKCAPIWASLPGAGYSQPERKLADLQVAFMNAGGTIAEA